MARRKRCSECEELHPPGELVLVGNELYCDRCLGDAAQEIAAESSIGGEPAKDKESPEEKAARLAEIRERVGTSAPPDEPPVPSLDDLGVTNGSGQPVSAQIAAKFADDAKASGDIHPEPDTPTETTDGQGMLGVPISVRDRVPPAADNKPFWRELRDVHPKGWPLRKPWLSPSSVARLLKCPEQFRLKDVLGIAERTNHNLIRGGAIHAAAEENWRYKIAHGDDMPPQDWEAAYLDHFADKVKKAGGFGAVTWMGKPSVLRDEALTAIRSYATNVAPTITPLATEEPFALQIPGVPVPVCGVVDIRSTVGIIDIKAGRNRSKEIKPDWRIAALVYGRASMSDVVYHCGNWSGSFYTPADFPALRQEISGANHQLAGDVIRSAVRTIQALYAEYGPDQPWPHALIHQYACKGCAFREDGSCRWWHPQVATI